MIPRTFEPAYSALYDSYSLGMIYDRTQACPTLNDQDPLKAYVDVSNEKVQVAMATQVRPDKKVKTEETCYWVMRPERDTWVTDASQLIVQIDSVKGGSLYIFEGTERNNITDSVIKKG